MPVLYSIIYVDLLLECLPHASYSSTSQHVIIIIMFGPLKEMVDGKKFSTGEEIKEVVHNCQSEIYFFPEYFGQQWRGGRPAPNVMGIVLKSDKEFQS